MGKEPTWFDTIAITGHRDFEDIAAMYRGLDRVSARQYFLGGARGIDTSALKYLAQTQPESIRTVVVPNTILDQPLEARFAIEEFATNVIELREQGPGRYILRNRYMVDNSERTIGFYDYRGRGGTFRTIEYAKSEGKLLEVHPLIKFDPEEILKRSLEEQMQWLKEMREFKTYLSPIKEILLRIILKNFNMAIVDFAEMIGYPGCSSLEQLWSY